MAKRIEKGPFKGLRIITVSELKKQQAPIPVTEQIVTQSNVKLTPEGCKGDIEKCQFLCGACIHDHNAPSLTGTRFQRTTVLDVAAYYAQNPGIAMHVN